MTHFKLRGFNGRIVVLAALAPLLLTGCLKRTLVTGISETEGREIAVALYNGHIQSDVAKEAKAKGAQQQEGTWQVDIRGGDRTQLEAWRVLQENGLPRHTESGIEEVYRNSQLIPTATEERARFVLALSGELSRSLKTLPGVIDARVHVALPDPSVLRDPADKTHATASVLIKYRKGAQQTDEKARAEQDLQVKQLVANAVEGLAAANISILPTTLKEPDTNLASGGAALMPTLGFFVDHLLLLVQVLLVLLLVSKLGAIVEWFKAQGMQIWARVR